MKKLFIIIIIFVGISLFGIFILQVYRALQVPPETPRVTVTIPEGSNVLDINNILKDEGVLDGEEFSNEAEGYLFPDTYEFFVPSSIDVVREKFQKNLEIKTKDILPEGGSNFQDIITIASLVEKEVRSLEDKRIVAGIIIKRLRNGIPLQIDASICYTKKTRCLPITKVDKENESLYNTYKYRGLPKGPISNPGLDSIRASVDPKESPYLYYISDPDTGDTIFAKTLDEHNANVVKYLSN